MTGPARIDKLIAVNPMREVRRPASVPVEAKHLTPAEVRVLLKAAEGLRYKTALDLLASTGLRRGEALALAWADIDLNGGTPKVSKTVISYSQPNTAGMSIPATCYAPSRRRE